MRVITISDTHGYHRQGYGTLPECDILIHAGDFTTVGGREEVESFVHWILTQPAKEIVVIPGNHDREIDSWKDLFDGTRIHFLLSRTVEIAGLKIHGSPWTPWFHDWAFNFPKDDNGAAAIAEWALIPDDTNILITHGPPHGVFDVNRQGIPCGCPALMDRVKQLPGLRLHVFGHIHEGFGVREYSTPIYVNASLMQVRNGKHWFQGPYNPYVEVDL